MLYPVTSAVGRECHIYVRAGYAGAKRKNSPRRLLDLDSFSLPLYRVLRDRYATASPLYACVGDLHHLFPAMGYGFGTLVCN